MDKRNILILGLAFIVVLLNGLIGHFFAPNGIFLTPFVLTITASLIAFRTKNLKPIWKSVLIYSFMALNDFSIKLYSGGSHDNEGLGFVHLFLFIGLLPTFGILITTITNDKQTTTKDKILAITIFPILTGIHLYLFSGLGLGRYYPVH